MRNAAVMLIIKDGLILGITRRSDQTKWGLVGGKVDEGETIKEAAIRECKEECGVIVKECVEIYHQFEPKHSPDGIDFMSYCFYATDWEGEPSKCEDMEVAWITAKQLTSDETAAFGSYNRATLATFTLHFPEVILK